MINFLEGILVLIIVGMGVWIFYLLKEKKIIGKVMPALMEKQAKEKAENKQKILKFLENSEKVANNDVEKLLSVSNATAERYLDELEKEGILKQKGKIGRDVYYDKIK